jgi:three-Cys-motif partner protein
MAKLGMPCLQKREARLGKKQKRDQWPELCKLVEADDNLPVNPYGQWTENKLHFWNRYIEITTTSMVGHPSWPVGLYYVDLFAGPGVCQIEESGRRLPGSPLIAARAPKSFNHLLLCELENELADACESRLRRLAPGIPATVFRGNCNDRIGEIRRQIPRGALTLAFIDPQGLDIEFDTIRQLAESGQVDLLILVADAVDFVRNVDHIYVNQDNSKVDKFLGRGQDWRSQWRALGNTQGPNARNFLSNLYQLQLKRLGYIEFREKPILGKNGPLYRILFASKHERGAEFWDKVTKKDVFGQRDLL